MKYLTILLIALSIGCFKEEQNTPQVVNIDELQIRIENASDKAIDRLEIGAFVFENITAGTVTDYQIGKEMTVEHIEEFLPSITIDRETYNRDIGFFCGMPPIPSFQMAGTFKVIIESFSTESSVFAMSQEEE